MSGRLATVVAAFGIIVLGMGACDEGTVDPQTAGPDFDWKTGTSAQKSGYMSSTVVPHMGDLFKGHDAAKFANFSCTNCHQANTFAIPNPDLPQLSQAAFPQKGDSATVDFMYDTVVPEMREILGLGETDFTCASCHVVNP